MLSWFLGADIAHSSLPSSSTGEHSLSPVLPILTLGILSPPSPTLPQVAVMDVDGCWDDWGDVVMDAPSSVWNT